MGTSLFPNRVDDTDRFLDGSPHRDAPEPAAFLSSARGGRPLDVISGRR